MGKWVTISEPKFKNWLPNGKMDNHVWTKFNNWFPNGKMGDHFWTKFNNWSPNGKMGYHFWPKIQKIGFLMGKWVTISEPKFKTWFPNGKMGNHFWTKFNNWFPNGKMGDHFWTKHFLVFEFEAYFSSLLLQIARTHILFRKNICVHPI